MEEKVIKAFTEVVREEVSANREVELKGIGSFSLNHQKQFQKQQEDGRVVMLPPKDEIVFTSAKSNLND